MDTLLLIGSIILVGVIGNLLFNKTKIPEALFLIVLGLIIGPFLHIIDPAPFIEVAPLLATLALIIILLDSGLSFNIFSLIKNFSKTILFTITCLTLTTLFTTFFFHYIMHWEWLNALLISVITAGTTSITVSYLVSKLSIDHPVKELLMMESVISDVLLITAAIIIIEIIVTKQVNIKHGASTLASSFSIALVIAIFLAIFWVYILGKHRTKLSYVATVGILFILYALVEYLRGSGAIAVLVFCILLGNSSKLFEKIKFKSNSVHTLPVKTMKDMQTVQSAISFFTKTFFFFLLGLIFNTSKVSSKLVLIAFAMLLVALVARYLSTRILIRFDNKFKNNTFLITTILPRGFVATVLAFMPSSYGIEIPYLIEIVLLVIFFTTFIAIISVALYEKGYMRPVPLDTKSSKTKK